ncbi:MAG TPA: aspartate--tRNA ligase [Candidatus Brocadiia bacterium]|nr:aspartate--tRNA ligase [Candidatus Brocadiia bacterium]
MIRTHTCGELRKSNLDQEVRLAGWVNSWRDHGGLVFIDLRDRYGLTQVVFSPRTDAKLHDLARTLRSEYVVAVRGKVAARPEGTVNPSMPTGEIEIAADDLEIQNKAETPAIDMAAEDSIATAQRMEWRVLDLRRPVVQQRLIFRHKVARIMRRYFDSLDFVDVETPFLAKSTPEGARDFLVPCRLNPGTFFALPQSPQLFKQLLMVAGFDRYYQIVRCFRDEDLRAQRQPEFTQLDVEMSFIGMEDIIGIIEGMMALIFKETLGLELSLPIQRMTYREAMDKYGCDAPDIRYGMNLCDVSDIAKRTTFRVFTSAIESGGVIKGFNAKGFGDLSRKDIDNLQTDIAGIGAKGLAWLKYGDEGLASPIRKFFSDDLAAELATRMNAQKGDLLLFVADEPKIANTCLSFLRTTLARSREGIIPKGIFKLTWVVDFPLVEWNKDEKRWDSVHHPFTAPHPDDVGLIETDPGNARSLGYDLVMNGVELGGGSIRMHRREMQEKVFNLLGISPERARDRFGFLLKNLEYGAPPHGGIAFGLDRMVAMLQGADDIREVIAFPKNQKAACPLTGAPSVVEPKQLRELHIKLADET